MREKLQQYAEFTCLGKDARSKLKIVTIHDQVKNLEYDRRLTYRNILAKNQVSAVFYLRFMCRRVSPKFIELLSGDAMFVPFGGHKHGGRKVTETSITEFCY